MKHHLTIFSSRFSIADSLKMLALERVRGKFFTRAWGEFSMSFDATPRGAFITLMRKLH